MRKKILRTSGLALGSALYLLAMMGPGEAYLEITNDTDQDQKVTLFFLVRYHYPRTSQYDADPNQNCGEATGLKVVTVKPGQSKILMSWLVSWVDTGPIPWGDDPWKDGSFRSNIAQVYWSATPDNPKMPQGSWAHWRGDLRQEATKKLFDSGKIVLTKGDGGK